MKGSGKKIISVIAAIAAVCAMGVAFIGCGSGEDGINRNKKYVIFADGDGNEYRLVTDSVQTVEYEYEEGKIYNFDYNVYYSQNDEFTLESGSFKVDAGVSGTKELIVYAGLRGGGYSVTVLYVVIKEKPRLTPEISFDPNGAIEYIENEKYVYEYDPSEYPKYPIIKLSYNGKALETTYDGAHAATDLETGERMRVNDVKKGAYSFSYVVQDEDYVNESDQGVYEELVIRVIVEYIEI